MTEKKRKIHVIGINSYKFEDLPLKLQNLFQNTVSIAVPKATKIVLHSILKRILFLEKKTRKLHASL